MFDCLAKDPEDRPQRPANWPSGSTRRSTARGQAGGGRRGGRHGRSSGRIQPRHAGVRRRPAGHHGAAIGDPTPLHQSADRDDAVAAVPHGSVDAGADRHHEAARLRPRRRRRGGRKRAGADQGPARRSKGQASGAFAGWASVVAGVVDVELHLQHASPDEENRLTVHVLFRPSHPRARDDDWRGDVADLRRTSRLLMGRERPSDSAGFLEGLPRLPTLPIYRRKRHLAALEPWQSWQPCGHLCGKILAAVPPLLSMYEKWREEQITVSDRFGTVTLWETGLWKWSPLTTSPTP